MFCGRHSSPPSAPPPPGMHDRRVVHERRRRETALERGRIQERLERRAGLPLRLHRRGCTCSRRNRSRRRARRWRRRAGRARPTRPRPMGTCASRALSFRQRLDIDHVARREHIAGDLGRRTQRIAFARAGRAHAMPSHSQSYAACRCAVSAVALRSATAVTIAGNRLPRARMPREGRRQLLLASAELPRHRSSQRGRDNRGAGRIRGSRAMSRHWRRAAGGCRSSSSRRIAVRQALPAPSVAASRRAPFPPRTARRAR